MRRFSAARGAPHDDGQKFAGVCLLPALVTRLDCTREGNHGTHSDGGFNDASSKFSAYGLSDATGTVWGPRARVFRRGRTPFPIRCKVTKEQHAFSSDET